MSTALSPIRSKMRTITPCRITRRERQVREVSPLPVVSIAWTVAVRHGLVLVLVHKLLGQRLADLDREMRSCAKAC
jgi:hypothetical protein